MYFRSALLNDLRDANNEEANYLLTKYSSNAIENLKSELEHEFEVSTHVKKDLLFYKAWDRGHSCGYYEVIMVYEDLVELIK